jgi:PAS domain S-box-containing protein
MTLQQQNLFGIVLNPLLRPKRYTNLRKQKVFMNETLPYFDAIFNNAKVNAILIMDAQGIIEQVNAAFTTAYGYTTNDLKTKHFRLLYIEKDQLIRRPEIELNTTHREGSSSDENYIVHKDGTPIWITGETILAKTDNSTCIVKIIHNIHAQKQLERYLLSTSELLESLFHSVQQSGLLILDSTLKMVKANESFKKMFGLTEPIAEGAKLQEIPHPFWSSEEIKHDLRSVIVSGTALQKDYIIDKGDHQFQRLHITSKTITSNDGSEKQVLLVIKEE